LIPIYQITQHDVTAGSDLRTHCCMDFKPNIQYSLFHKYVVQM